MTTSTRTLGTIIFPQFELLDVTGPLEMFGSLSEHIKIVLIAEHVGAVKSTQNVALHADYDFNSVPKLDVLLIPGGQGTRKLVDDVGFINAVKKLAQAAELILTVCTGSALLAKTGLLDQRFATSNKLAFDWIKQQGPQVKWIDQARWVDDGDIITSSGVAAGIDMSLYVIEKLFGVEMSENLAKQKEYIRNHDPHHYPFAKGE